jgi:acyl-CoA thioesterase FadM
VREERNDTLAEVPFRESPRGPAPELARIDLQLRTGLATLAARKGWAAPMASISVQFRKPLKRFQKVRVSARLVSWDDRWLHIAQRIDRGDEIVAAALAKVMIVGKEGRIAPTALAAELGEALAPREAPPMIESSRESENLLREYVERW